ncbi:metal-sensitive transcriptional regulator [Arcanobacterium pinnipediorum]|uniref:Metal-sensitive transcriptional regulator n=1 Tax=Arcanobacterium pinnipediorum TaxID=1503041 RepID=A0ABY5AGH3_9ACTO|nr:metal-sensitive transcriptional regulator [Arcanobacterium pinnipediorum]USR79294.1 metal-sensitive transcriptional regulator [Arcanobacterium pinnipediorum]
MHLPAQDVKPAITRLKRARGQLDAVIAALESEQDCHEIIPQLAAVAKAIDRAGYLVISTGMKKCYTDGHDIEEEHLEKMFLSLA